jgi:hypothetical protein
MKCNKTLSKWCKNKHGASKIIDTFETYQCPPSAISITVVYTCKNSRGSVIPSYLKVMPERNLRGQLTQRRSSVKAKQPPPKAYAGRTGQPPRASDVASLERPPGAGSWLHSAPHSGAERTSIRPRGAQSGPGPPLLGRRLPARAPQPGATRAQLPPPALPLPGAHCRLLRPLVHGHSARPLGDRMRTRVRRVGTTLYIRSHLFDSSFPRFVHGCSLCRRKRGKGTNGDQGLP